MRAFWRGAEWPFVWTLAATASVLGFWGFSESSATDSRSVLDGIYLTLQLIVLESGAVPPPVPWQLEIARFLAPALAAYTAGRALALIFRDELQGLRVRLWRDHIVVCGLGQKGLLLVRAFRSQGARVVAIERDAANQHVQACRDEGAVVLIESATAAATVAKAGATRARYVIAVCDLDGTNAEVALHARALAQDHRKRRVPLTCFAHIVDSRLCDLLREREVARPIARRFRLEFFNVFENGARALLEEHPPSVTRGQPSHPLVVGFGRLGQSLVLNLLRRSSPVNGGPRQMSILDKAATARLRELPIPPAAIRWCELVPYDMDVGSPEFEQADFLFDAAGRSTVTAVYVCFDDETKGVAAALALHRRASAHGIPVIVRTSQDAGLATLLAGRVESPIGTVRSFGFLNKTCTPDVLITNAVTEVLAKAIHAAYLRSRTQAGDTVAMNPSMVPWHRLPEDLKEDNRKQADEIARNVHTVGYVVRRAPTNTAREAELAPEEVDRLAQAEHERWVTARQAAGWRYAPGAKDASRRTHPALVSWSALPDEYLERNRAAVRMLPLLLVEAGLELSRHEGRGNARI